MADIKTSGERSHNMSQIHSKDTKPEIYFRKMLFGKGFRYRKNVNFIPGHPDVWMARYNAAIFVNGCYWHRHKGCKYSYTPKTRLDFWTAKFQNNVNRDYEVRVKLRNQGIRVLTIWECTIKKMIHSEQEEQQIMHKVESFLKSDLPELEL